MHVIWTLCIKDDWYFIFCIKKDKEREKEVQPSTLLMARRSEEDIVNYILQWRMHTQEKNFLGINLTNIVMCMLVDITSTIAHHSFYPMPFSHCVVVNTYNNKIGKRFLVWELKAHDSVVTFHLSKASTLPNKWWSFSFCHNGKNATSKHLH